MAVTLERGNDGNISEQALTFVGVRKRNIFLLDRFLFCKNVSYCIAKCKIHEP
jgi:hypothetical protein